MLRARPVLIYDGNCAFCRRWIARLKRWDHGNRIEMVPARHRDDIPRMPAISDADLDRAIHLITVDNRVLRGGRALPELLRWLPGSFLLRVLCMVPGMGLVLNLCYDRVAARRHRLGCEDGACGA